MEETERPEAGSPLERRESARRERVREDSQPIQDRMEQYMVRRVKERSIAYTRYTYIPENKKGHHSSYTRDAPRLTKIRHRKGTLPKTTGESVDYRCLMFQKHPFALVTRQAASADRVTIRKHFSAASVPRPCTTPTESAVESATIRFPFDVRATKRCPRS